MPPTAPSANRRRSSSDSGMRAVVNRLVRRYWYSFLQLHLRMLGLFFYQFRCYHGQRMRFEGPALFLSNHQSNLDPLLIGIACNEPLKFIARRTLFNFPPLGWLMNSLDAISINRDGMGLDGIKETLRRLKQNKKVVLFPEGRRSTDGQVARLRPGFCAMARRGSVAIVPIGIDGAFDAWPRDHRLPRPGSIHIWIGKPIESEEIARHTDEELVDLVESRIRECHAMAQKTRGSAACHVY